MKLTEVDESSATSICASVRSRLEAVSAATVGLNYTGGTKAMSVHAYRAVELWAKDKGISPIFSYLDARSLQMMFESDAFSGFTRCERVGRSIQLKLHDLMQLHAWSLVREPTRDPVLSATAGAIAKACSTAAGFEDWSRWIHREVRLKCRHINPALDDLVTDKKQKIEHSAQQVCPVRPRKDEGWKDNEALRSVLLQLPSSEVLAGVMTTLRSELGVPSDSGLNLSYGMFGNDPKRFCEWLYGKWLEHHVLDVLRTLSGDLEFHECGQNVETTGVQFDLDVIAMRGYQLFAVSCSTDTKKSLLKLKLFEADVRARQLGGDEARLALVCCAAEPQQIEREMQRDFGVKGRIRVFGRQDLVSLSEGIKTWIQAEDRED